jgi:hypothetical protein
MTDRAQFEAMLEALINDDQAAAKEIFHNIVVGKSREIYEELLESDFSKDQGNPYASDEEKVDEDETMEEDDMEESEEEEEESAGEDEESDDEEGDDAEGDDAEGDDADGEEDPFGGEEEGEGDIEDRVMDLEDALEDLKAEFEQLLSQEDEEGGHDMDAIHAAGDDMGGEHDMEMETPMMEYVNKVPLPKHGDNGVNTKSAVAGKNDMGGTTANIAKSFSTTSGGTQGGLAKPTAGDLTSGLGTIQNRPDSKAGKTGFKKQEPGHGPEKAGKKEAGVDKKSLIGTKIR